MIFLLGCYCICGHGDLPYSLHTFPTRRSSDLTGREATASLKSIGDLLKFDISQGTTGVSKVTKENIKVTSQGDNFIITSDGSVNAVKVISASGQLVTKAELTGITSTISTSGLNKGVYILNFDNGSTVKVVK